MLFCDKQTNNKNKSKIIRQCSAEQSTDTEIIDTRQRITHASMLLAYKWEMIKSIFKRLKSPATAWSKHLTILIN